MLFLISLAIAVLTAFLLDKPMKKRPAVFYITAAVLTVISIIIKQSDIAVNGFFSDYVLGIFTRGAIGAAFWAVVMWAGALPNGSLPIKKLMPIRGELSITAAILTLSHIVTYGVQYISDITRDRTGSGGAFRDFVITSIVCLIMVLIMLPLTVMSFRTVRKKMNAKTWKRIQRAAYLFYGLIFIHIMVLFIPKAQNGREGYFLNVLVYSAVFIGYAAMRVRKAFIVRNKSAVKTAPNVVCACAVIAPLILIGFIARDSGGNETITATKDVPAMFVFEAPESSTSSTSVTTSVTVTSEDTAESVTSTSVTASSSSSSGTSETETSSAETSQTTSAQTDEDVPQDEIETETENAAQEEIAPKETEAPAVKNEEPDEKPSETKPVATTKVQVQETTAAEPVYRFKNGTFEGTGEGYSGTVHVSITIENDYITAFSAYADDDDPDYFSDAMQYVIPQIQRSLSADADACSGATYSSKGIMEAANNALEKAMN